MALVLATLLPLNASAESDTSVLADSEITSETMLDVPADYSLRNNMEDNSLGDPSPIIVLDDPIVVTDRDIMYLRLNQSGLMSDNSNQFNGIDLSIDYWTLMRQAANEGTPDALRRGEIYELIRNYKLQVVYPNHAEWKSTEYFISHQLTGTEISQLMAETEERWYWNRKLKKYDSSIDYFQIMKECCQDEEDEILRDRGLRAEQYRNQKIQELNLYHLYPETDWYINGLSFEEIREKMVEYSDITANLLKIEKERQAEEARRAEAERLAAEEAAKNSRTAKIQRLKNEYPVAGQVYEILSNAGWSDVSIAGVLGNMMREVGGDTLNLQPYTYVYLDQTYYGLCMWSLYYTPQVGGQDVDGQIQVLLDTIGPNMGYFYGSGGYDVFLSITDPGDAAVFFDNYYERGAGQNTRYNNAWNAYNWITR